ncbi:hypothetical protein HELRODRAFT_164232 [Helobdella robusta]|uniref:Uncharacterized protein n=1 Tax=Helobdella robusta TaxID=6412 RepID=T1EV52_HELRO|nr:hypothetical protein HELRODRAFT_164232 [Helobdella robusta]ESN94400.1 hypothetical protein HELRODRAFT_164232 [Helobdella robusta]
MGIMLLSISNLISSWLIRYIMLLSQEDSKADEEALRSPCLGWNVRVKIIQTNQRSNDWMLECFLLSAQLWSFVALLGGSNEADTRKLLHQDTILHLNQLYNSLYQFIVERIRPQNFKK